jgi:hypothetical protein
MHSKRSAYWFILKGIDWKVPQWVERSSWSVIFTISLGFVAMTIATMRRVKKELNSLGFYKFITLSFYFCDDDNFNSLCRCCRMESTIISLQHQIVITWRGWRQRSRSSSVLLDEWNIKEERELLSRKFVRWKMQMRLSCFFFLYFASKKRLNKLGREREQCEVFHLISCECR